jgi:hypothetical protein
MFQLFLVAPLVIAGVVLVATWNLRDAIVAFRVAFFMWPVCLLFALDDQGAAGVALMICAIVVAIVISRVNRLPPIYYYPPTPPAPPPPRSMSCMVITVERRPPPPRISEMQGGELWYRAPGGGWQMHCLRVYTGRCVRLKKPRKISGK